jgi:hypothetical protein
MMYYEELHNLNGLLVESRFESIGRKQVEDCPGISFKEELPDSRWEEYVFTSPDALHQEDTRLTPGPFKYPLVLRRSGARMLIMSISRKIVEHILSNNFLSIFSPRPHFITIGVDRLVKTTIQQPTEYALSFVHARLPAFGASLRSVSFYGDDLGDASIFRENIKYMTCFVCGLRKASGGTEIVRLGTDGFISFYMTSPARVLEVEEVLSFLREKGYLSTHILDK